MATAPPQLYEVRSDAKVGAAKHVFAYPFGGGLGLGSQEECIGDELALVSC
jgi:hypothetical protein